MLYTSSSNTVRDYAVHIRNHYSVSILSGETLRLLERKEAAGEPDRLRET
jgi:hypothetical protein